MKKLFSKTFIAGVIALFVGFASVFGAQGIIKAMNPAVVEEDEVTDEEYAATHQRLLLDNLLKMGTFYVDGKIDFLLEDKTAINLGVDVKGDISDLNDIKLQGNVDLYLNGATLTTDIGYFKETSDNNPDDLGTLFFGYKTNKFYLETANVLEFVDMLPTDYGMELELPEELKSLDLNTISAKIDQMEEKTSPNGDIYFVLNLADDIDLFVKTDTEYNFKGIRTDEITYNGTKIKIDLSLEKVENIELVKPNKANYQNFKPVFNIFKSLYKTFKNKQNTINIAADIKQQDKDDEEVYNNLLNASLDLGYDIDNKSFQIEADISEKERVHHLGMLFEDKTAYLNMRATKVSIKFESVMDTIYYILDQLNIDVTEKLLDSVTDLLNNDEFAEMRAGLDDLVGQIQIGDTSLSIELDTDAIGLNMGKITPTITIENNKLKSISVHGLKFKTLKIDVDLTIKNYVKKVINKAEYYAIEPALTLVEAVMPLIKQTQFRIEFDAKIDSLESNVNDINVNGGLQFDISKEGGFGYGKALIVDRDNYHHEIKADMKTKDEFLFSYNDTLNGKFSSKTLKELYGLVDKIINEPDDHFFELFGEMVSAFKNTPLGKVMDGDYGAILESQLINSIEIDETHIAINLSLAIIGMEDKSCDFEINYHYDENDDKSYLDGIKLSNLVIDDNEITFNAYLKAFDSSKEVERLDPYESYLDFSDIKVLLQLGVNTSKFDYFHFSATLKLDIPLISLLFDDEMTLDIQIRNNHGKVQVAVEFYDLPVIHLLNGTDGYIGTDSRKASLYYDEDIFYVKRVDKAHTGLFNKKYYEVTYGATYETDYFLDNIAAVFLKDIFGLGDKTYETLVGTMSTDSSSSQIEYEKVLKDFRYSESLGQFDFKIDLYALTHVSVLQTLDLTVYEDKVTEQLTGLDVNVTVHFIGNIGITLKLTTVDKQTTLTDSNKLSALDSWAASREGATHNQFVEISTVRI